MIRENDFLSYFCHKQPRNSFCSRFIFWMYTMNKVTKKRQNGIWWWGGEQVMESARTIFSPFLQPKMALKGLWKKYSYSFLYTCRAIERFKLWKTCMTHKILMKESTASLLWWPHHVCSIVFDDSVSYYPFQPVWFLFSCPKKKGIFDSWWLIVKKIVILSLIFLVIFLCHFQKLNCFY